MSDGERPKTAWEHARDAYDLGDREAFAHLPRAPHCDPRILHEGYECVYCDQAIALQAERQRLEISNTGKQNRKWPCPADQARSAKNYNAWPGNRAYPAHEHNQHDHDDLDDDE